jgi:galactosamine-6-phosphate isomerase
MNIIVADSYAVMSQNAAAHVIDFMNQSTHPLICVASGDSPAGLYKELAEKVKRGELDIANWYFAGLDEWIGMNAEDQGSCRYILDQQLFQPLRVPENRICFFDGKAVNTKMECKKMEDYIALHGGLDVAVLGLGMNGHIGLNEPGTPAHLTSHVSVIAQQTQEVGQKYFNSARTLTNGITMGLATLLAAKHLILVVSGAKKAAILQQGLEGEQTENVPLSLLRNHPAFTVYCDKEAGRLLSGLSR